MNRFLAFLVIAFLTVIVFLFFTIQLRPIELQKSTSTQTSSTATEPFVTFVNPAKGARDPKLMIVEYADFLCDHCRDLQLSINTVLEQYPNEVRVVWKNYPNETVHPQSVLAAVAAHCADRQNKFWEFHDALFNRQPIVSENQYTQIAEEINLDVSRFSLCYQQRETAPLIQKDREEAIALKLNATPVLYVGKEQIVGLVQPQELLDVVKKYLSEP